MEFKPEELVISTFRSKHQSKGGWSYEPDQDVRIFHKPTGLESECEEYKSLYRNKAEALSILRNKISKPFHPKDYQPWVDKEVRINTEIDPSKLFHLGTHKHHLSEEISNSLDERIKDYRDECVKAEEQALREYFLCVHNIDIDQMLSLKQNVNNLKFKHFEKRVYLFATEYFFKGECFMTVDYEYNRMNSFQEETLVFEDGSTLEDNIIIVRKELLRLVEEKLANDEDNDTLQECVEWRKMRVEYVGL